MKVGDYVRTKFGEIARIDECKGKDKVYKNMEYYETDRMVIKFNNFILYKEDIIKSSPYIIDLIEIGDYVNGREVEWTADNFVAFGKLDYVYEKDIKSIVTHEEFASMEYKIGD